MRPDALTVVVRACGERTVGPCVALLCQALGRESVPVVEGVPFSRNLRESFRQGLEGGRAWTLIVDADALVLADGLLALLDEAEDLPDGVFEVQGTMYDKLFAAHRPVGIHLYRTPLLTEALDLVRDTGVRPESDVIRAMARRGHPWRQSRTVVGAHDFEQYYRDIYRKSFLHARKHAKHVEHLDLLWRVLEVRDPDFRVARAALAAGQSFEGTIEVSSQFRTAEINDALEALGVREKDIPASLPPPAMQIRSFRERIPDEHRRRAEDVGNRMIESLSRRTARACRHGRARVLREIAEFHRSTRTRQHDDEPVHVELVSYPERNGAHRNPLPREAFDLPNSDANLVDTFQRVLLEYATDGVCVVTPIGSLAYARRDGDAVWNLIHDIDVWVFCSADTLSRRDPHAVTLGLYRDLHDVLRGRGARSWIDPATGFLHLVDRTGRKRLVEIKIADVEWLAEGVRHLDELDVALQRRRKPAHMVRPRKEWAVYRPFENYFPSRVGEAPFREAVSRVSAGDRSRSYAAFYRANYVVALRALAPGRVLKALVSPRRFEKYARRVLKKLLFLGVMRDEAHLRSAAIAELEALPVAGARLRASGRLRYMHSLIRRVDRLHVIDTRRASLVEANDGVTPASSRN